MLLNRVFTIRLREVSACSYVAIKQTGAPIRNDTDDIAEQVSGGEKSSESKLEPTGESTATESQVL